MLPWLEETLQERAGTDFTSHSLDIVITVFVISFYPHGVDTFVWDLCYLHFRQRHSPLSLLSVLLLFHLCGLHGFYFEIRRL